MVLNPSLNIYDYQSALNLQIFDIVIIKLEADKFMHPINPALHKSLKRTVNLVSYTILV